MGGVKASTVKIIYGASIRIPDEFLCPIKQNADPATFVRRLRESEQRFSPPPNPHHGQNIIFMNKDLSTCSHIFLWTDFLKKGLQPPYKDPINFYRTKRMFRTLMHGKEVTVSVDRLKPTYVPKELVDIPTECTGRKRCSLNQRKPRTWDKKSRQKVLAGTKPQHVPN
ncbi:retrovirus-related Pol polyprotein from transposon 412 [Nephila pilipes]|uniref:Retrovirus-related Pol polyprotein from transposon 412 n=1 Tax=Nephila pilipes TaxID=299642 RepID=A0A8X6PBJ0_NEPPI|nr:retrovirus-related Pol polyprotein from transposon 412 [Nephila pilipes]